MAIWNDVVDDRTQEDIDFARYVIERLKGVFNVTDINRVEQNIQYLSDKLNELGYTNTVYTRTWIVDDLPTDADISRIILNVKKLIFAYYRSKEAPELPPALIHYSQVNALEKNLRLIKEMIDNYYLTLPRVGAYPSGNRPVMYLKGGQ